MNKVDAVVLWLLFGGGTVLAAGSVLSSIKRSLSAPAAAPTKYTTPAVSDELLPETEFEQRALPEPALLALPLPETQPAEIETEAQSPNSATARTGKNKKKGRRTEPRKRAQGRNRREGRNASRRKNRN